MASNAPTRQQMLKWVDMVSFSAHEANLYLDTHPSDPAALQYFQDYAAMYGPLTVDLAIGSRGKWDWIQQPWPWEGGTC